jgi:hypothetical protein
LIGNTVYGAPSHYNRARKRERRRENQHQSETSPNLTHFREKSLFSHGTRFSHRIQIQIGIISDSISIVFHIPISHFAVINCNIGIYTNFLFSTMHLSHSLSHYFNHQSFCKIEIIFQVVKISFVIPFWQIRLLLFYPIDWGNRLLQ